MGIFAYTFGTVVTTLKNVVRTTFEVVTTFGVVTTFDVIYLATLNKFGYGKKLKPHNLHCQ